MPKSESWTFPDLIKYSIACSVSTGRSLEKHSLGKHDGHCQRSPASAKSVLSRQ